MTDKVAKLLIKKWGNSFGVRLPFAIARAAKLQLDQEVEVFMQDDCIVIKPVGEPKKSLDQKLAEFDPQKHVVHEALK